MQKTNTNGGIGVVTFMYLMLSVVYVAIGFSEILIPEFKQVSVVILAGFLLLIIGILLIVQYFISGGFKDLGKYGFSVGVFCVLAGAIVLIRHNEIVSVLGLFLGICILVTAVIKLQNAVDLKTLDHRGWVVFFFIAAAFLIIAILIIIDPSELFSHHMAWIFYVMIADGLVNLFSTVYLAIIIRADKRKTATLTTVSDSDRVPVTHRETAAERISEDDVEVIVPNSRQQNTEKETKQPNQTKGETGGFWNKKKPGIQDKKL